MEIGVNSNFEQNITVALSKINLKLSNPTELLNIVTSNLQKGVNTAFNSEIDPDDSSPWAELLTSTKRRKKYGKKLQETLTGRNSIKIYIKKTSIYVDFQDYMIHHIRGTSKMVKRNFMPTPKESDVLMAAEKMINKTILDSSRRDTKI